MKRTSHRRPHDIAGTVTKPDPLLGPTAPAPAREESTEKTVVGIGWGWRLALFLWGSSFVFLFVYEILMTLFPGNGK